MDLRACFRLTTIGVLVFVPWEGVACEKLRPDKTDADVLCVTDKWAVWRTSELDETTRKFRAQFFVHRFYRQRVSQPMATLVHTERDTRVRMIATVTGDGTVVLARRGRLSWHPADGTSVTETTHLQISALYTDGAVLHKTTGFELHPVFFVPFKDHGLDMASRIELIPAGTGRFTHPPVVRHGALLTWILMDVSEGATTDPTAAWDATLHIYDLESAKRKTMKLNSRLHKSYGATAFDGDIVMSHSFVFDATDGKCLNAVGYPERPTHLQNVFAVRKHIGYYVHDRALYATDLMSADLPSLKLISLPKPAACAQTDSGIIAWNGTRWETVAWLKHWPAKNK